MNKNDKERPTSPSEDYKLGVRDGLIRAIHEIATAALRPVEVHVQNRDGIVAVNHAEVEKTGGAK